MRAYQLLVSTLLLAQPCVSSATNLQPTPKPGLWETETTTLINGENIMQQLEHMRSLLLLNMSESQREQAADLFDSAPPLIERACITRTLASTMTTPEAVMAQAQQRTPDCALDSQQSSANTLQFSGQCNDPASFVGDLHGEIRFVSSSEIRFSFQGNGNYRLPFSMQSAAHGEDDVISQTTISRWLSSDCGTIKPKPAF